MARLIVVNYTNFLQFETSESDGTKDGVHLYATEVLTLGLLWHYFHDAIREGDGDRIIRCWKFFLVLFKSTSHRNYAKEAVNLHVQYHYTFSEKQRVQLLWSRCINTRGYTGTNIPGDLHMEHLNRRLKSVIRGMGANVNPSSVQRAGKSIAVVDHICRLFNGRSSDHHPIPEFGEDFDKVLKVLEEERVFLTLSDRQHYSFGFKCGVFERFTMKELEKKVKNNIAKLLCHT